ncbi:beta-galactosidase-1-like protein 2 [Neodiprion pinetum]|uniref:beta-galactosidase-1-like protein 2 n=1 Tax=Neodiprion pinetum TaxID=441929 RepID=UPI001EDCC45D|nr:beta-galactosidase-1-like protein 2 [Neodiprion pinetum]XP_046473338.1 beta-galactosidase-1-like protein 2 [Neodiprion pinetum]
MSLPTLYQHYVSPKVNSGLYAKPDGFYLNGKKISLHSGALHYFRVPQAYWRDRLRKYRAAGLNAVETYVPWNLHEPLRDVFDFGDGDNDFSDFLDVVKFIKIAQEEDLFVIVRPGPYICAEWDFGGLPSWILNEEGLKLRTSEPKYMKRVTDYFNKLLPLFTDLQFTKGGPIIAFQIENEYGSVEEDGTVPDIEYLKQLKDLFVNHGLVEMFFTSDTPTLHRDAGSLPGVLQMANFKVDPEKELNLLKELQPNHPAMVMEYWTGWFDHWLEPYHSIEPVHVYADVLERILSFPSSVNFYMFHGGTNFGFMNGANVFENYQADVTSYDYDSPITEAGDYTPKYHKTKEILAKHQTVITKLPDLPAESSKVAYPTLKIFGHLDFEDILDQLPADLKVKLSNVTNMENLPIKNGNGQSYGYINYRKKVALKTASTLKISGYVQDTAMVLVDGELKSKPLETEEDINGFGYWMQKDAELTLNSDKAGEKTLDIIVENWGRVNFGVLANFDQRKGLWQGPVYVDDKELKDWEIYALEFDSKWAKSLTNWKLGPPSISTRGPSVSRFVINLALPQDTFIDLRGWTKGLVFVNGFNLGRYCHLGPTRTLYLPAPLLKKGQNEILVFEHFKSDIELSFLDYPILGDLKP